MRMCARYFGKSAILFVLLLSWCISLSHTHFPIAVLCFINIIFIIFQLCCMSANHNRDYGITFEPCTMIIRAGCMVCDTLCDTRQNDCRTFFRLGSCFPSFFFHSCPLLHCRSWGSPQLMVHCTTFNWGCYDGSVLFLVVFIAWVRIFDWHRIASMDECEGKM